MSSHSKPGKSLVASRRRFPNQYFGLQHVSKAFGSAVVLDDVTFEINQGSTVCIMDCNGAGKIIFHLLMGFLNPDAGRVISAGKDITNCSADQIDAIHRKVTIVFQDGTVFNHLACDKADRITNRIHLARYEENDRWASIEEALAEAPEAVLLDHSMAEGMLARTRRFEALLLRRKAEGTLTSIVITRDIRFARRISDQILFLDRGKALFAGTVYEMMRSVSQSDRAPVYSSKPELSVSRIQLRKSV